MTPKGPYDDGAGADVEQLNRKIRIAR